MPTGRTRGSHDRPLPDLLARHHALRAEQIRVVHWRRLVRARTDLAAASLAMPEPLGADVATSPGDDVGGPDVPRHLELVDAVAAGGPEGEIDRLEQLRALDRRLARYEASVDGALDETTDELLHRLLTRSDATCTDA